jgi:hypothetical protein
LLEEIPCPEEIEVAKMLTSYAKVCLYLFPVLSCALIDRSTQEKRHVTDAIVALSSLRSANPVEPPDFAGALAEGGWPAVLQTALLTVRKYSTDRMRVVAWAESMFADVSGTVGAWLAAVCAIFGLATSEPGRCCAFT